MNIGVIGAGGIGRAFAGHAAKAGYEVIISNSRGADSLTDAAKQLGPRVRAGTREQAAQAELVFISVPWDQVHAALHNLPAWNGRVVIDATNPVLQPGFRLAELSGSTSSEVVASLVPGARVVKTANTLLRDVLAADPRQNGGRRLLFMSGNDADAKDQVKAIFEKAGFAMVDLGALAIGGSLQQFPGGPLPTLNLIMLD
jgi:hypothetical protein